MSEQGDQGGPGHQIGPPTAFGVRRINVPEDTSYHAYGPDAVSTAILMGALFSRSGYTLEMVDSTETRVAQIGTSDAVIG